MCKVRHSFKFVFIITIVTLISFTFSISANARDIKVKLNGEPIAFDVPPQIINNRTMVPMRAIFEALGAEVDWEDSTKTIIATKHGITVVMRIGYNIMYVDNKTIELDAPPQLVNNRTLVPVRAIAESFNLNVEWNDFASTVLISRKHNFQTKEEAFDYLCNWLIDNGEPLANNIRITRRIDIDTYIDICCYPHLSIGKTIAVYLTTYYDDDMLHTSLFLDRGDNYNNYFNSNNDKSLYVMGELDISIHTDRYPLSYSYDRIALGSYRSEYSLVEDTRKRINELLNECEKTLHQYNIGVTLYDLGFKKY